MRRLRPILLRVLAAGDIGAVLTVGVTVGCAMRREPAMSPLSGMMYWKKPSTRHVFAVMALDQNWHGRSAFVMSCGEWPGLPTSGGVVMSSCPLPHEVLATPLQRDLRQARCEGWPRVCTWGAIDCDVPEENCMGDLPPRALRQSVMVNMISARRGALPNPAQHADGVLPIGPIWSGLAINTVFYGAIAWTLLFLPGTLRRWRRRRSGRCGKCGYDRAGLAAHVACPECGGADTKYERRSTKGKPG